MNKQKIQIRTCKPGELSYISYLHCLVYEKEYDFDHTFEYYLLDAMAEYLKGSESKGNVWVVDNDGTVGGSIAIVEKEGNTAQLRWFILTPELRSLGLGKKLMETALEYCRAKKYDKVFLWTVAHLEAARHLYEQYGFSKMEEIAHSIWGQDIVEERWDLDLK